MSIIILIILPGFILLISICRVKSLSDLRADAAFREHQRNVWRKWARANGRFLE